MNIRDLRQMVEAAANRQARIALGLGGDENPQTVAARTETLGRKRAYEAILEAIDAKRPTAAFTLNLDAKGIQ